MKEKNKIVAGSRTMFAAGIILVGCSKSQPPAESTASQPPKTEAPVQPAATPSPAESAPAPDASAKAKRAEPAPHNYLKELLSPAKLKEKAPDTYQVKFDTTRGQFTVTVTRAWAPLGADRFYNLVQHHFYDNAAFFRVVPGFVVQFGISPTPAVSAAWKHTEIKDDPVTQTNKRGSLTFATAGPNTRAP